MSDDRTRPAILVVGATGYVGGRLVPLLASHGYRVRAMGRSLGKLNCRPWARDPLVETVPADVRDSASFERAARGCRAAVYLVHSMIAEKKGQARADREGALNMAAVAAAHDLERIVYLGGLGDRDDRRISPHLRSRHEVETILAAGPVPVTNLRAAMILGSGSSSFEMLRYLVERLPVMTPPRWVDTPCQPIAIADVLIQRTPVRQAIRTALDKILTHQVDTCWTDAGQLLPPAWAACGDAPWAGGTLLTSGYRVRIRADVQAVWKVVRSVGGDRGWFYAQPLWRRRGMVDRLVGGVGLLRGRRHPEQIGVGDVIDFWRVSEVEDGRKLVLLAEMKFPGQATLTFEVTPCADETCELALLSRFMPQGMAGIGYWYGFYPFHELIFFGMAKAIARATGHPIHGKSERFTPRAVRSCALP